MHEVDTRVSKLNIATLKKYEWIASKNRQVNKIFTTEIEKSGSFYFTIRKRKKRKKLELLNIPVQSLLRELLVVTTLLNRGSLVAFAARGVPYLFVYNWRALVLKVAEVK